MVAHRKKTASAFLSKPHRAVIPTERMVSINKRLKKFNASAKEAMGLLNLARVMEANENLEKRRRGPIPSVRHEMTVAEQPVRLNARNRNRLRNKINRKRFVAGIRATGRNMGTSLSRLASMLPVRVSKPIRVGVHKYLGVVPKAVRNARERRKAMISAMKRNVANAANARRRN